MGVQVGELQKNSYQKELDQVQVVELQQNSYKKEVGGMQVEELKEHSYKELVGAQVGELQEYIGGVGGGDGPDVSGEW